MLSMILAAALAAPAVPADGTYAYDVSIAGMSTGKTIVTLAHDSAGFHVNETANASFNGADYAASAQLALDAALTPTGYTATYNPPGRTVHAKLAFNSAAAAQTGDNGNETFPLENGTKRFIVLDGTMFAGFFMLPAQLQAWNSQPLTAVAPMFDRAVSIAPDKALKPSRPKNVAGKDASISVSDPIEFTVWYDPSTLIVDEVDVPQQAASFVRLPAR